jgi:hypothetical protein
MNADEAKDVLRHQSLVRWVLEFRERDQAGVKDWLKKWNVLHPNSEVEKDAKEQWAKGNRGKSGDWR